MMKKAIILGMIFLTFGCVLNAQTTDIPTTNSTSSITINVEESTIHVQNANRLSLEIYDVVGKKVATYRIDSANKTINVNLPKGYYIIKIGKIVRRIAIL